MLAIAAVKIVMLRLHADRSHESIARDLAKRPDRIVIAANHHRPRLLPLPPFEGRPGVACGRRGFGEALVGSLPVVAASHSATASGPPRASVPVGV